MKWLMPMHVLQETMAQELADKATALDCSRAELAELQEATRGTEASSPVYAAAKCCAWLPTRIAPLLACDSMRAGHSGDQAG